MPLNSVFRKAGRDFPNGNLTPIVRLTIKGITIPQHQFIERVRVEDFINRTKAAEVVIFDPSWDRIENLILQGEVFDTQSFSEITGQDGTVVPPGTDDIDGLPQPDTQSRPANELPANTIKLQIGWLDSATGKRYMSGEDEYFLMEYSTEVVAGVSGGTRVTLQMRTIHPNAPVGEGNSANDGSVESELSAKQRWFFVRTDGRRFVTHYTLKRGTQAGNDANSGLANKASQDGPDIQVVLLPDPRLHEGKADYVFSHADIVRWIADQNGWSTDFVEPTSTPSVFAATLPQETLDDLENYNASELGDVLPEVRPIIQRTNDIKFITNLRESALNKRNEGPYLFYIEKGNAHFHTPGFRGAGENVFTYIVNRDRLGRVLDFRVTDLHMSRAALAQGLGLMDAGAEKDNEDGTRDRAVQSDESPLPESSSLGNVRRRMVDQATFPSLDYGPAKNGTFDPNQFTRAHWYLHSLMVLRSQIVLIGEPSMTFAEKRPFVRVLVFKPSGDVHYHSGVFAVLGIVHEISPGNFTTSLELLRNAGEVGDLELFSPSVRDDIESFIDQQKITPLAQDVIGADGTLVVPDGYSLEESRVIERDADGNIVVAPTSDDVDDIAQAIVTNRRSLPGVLVIDPFTDDPNQSNVARTANLILAVEDPDVRQSTTLSQFFTNLDDDAVNVDELDLNYSFTQSITDENGNVIIDAGTAPTIGALRKIVEAYFSEGGATLADRSTWPGYRAAQSRGYGDYFKPWDASTWHYVFGDPYKRDDAPSVTILPVSFDTTSKGRTESFLVEFRNVASLSFTASDVEITADTGVLVTVQTVGAISGSNLYSVRVKVDSNSRTGLFRMAIRAGVGENEHGVETPPSNISDSIFVTGS